MNRKILARVVSLFAIAVMLLLILSCGQPATTQDILGLVKALDGNQLVITLDDGSTVTVNVEKKSPDAQPMLGKQVQVKVKDTNKGRELVDISRRGEDTQLAGTIVSQGPNSFIIGGRTVKVTAGTSVDRGLKVGAPARVEGIELRDGTILATRIEASADAGKANQEVGEDVHLVGRIDSISANSIVVDGKTFKIDSSTQLDRGLAVGVSVRLHFSKQADGSLKAEEIETSAPDNKGVSGADSARDKGADDKGATSGADSTRGQGTDNKGATSGADSARDQGTDDKGATSGADSARDQGTDNKGATSGADSPQIVGDDNGGVGGSSGGGRGK